MSTKAESCNMKKLILASSSQPRQLLLKQLQVPYEAVNPDVDETPLPNESAQNLVKRLALSKARAVSQQFEDALIIGADQVAELDGQIKGKPNTIENVRADLHFLSGRRIRFYTGLCLLDTKLNTYQLAVETYDSEMIERYLLKEQPLNCAASCKVEGFGIALIEEFEGNDFNALIGLPLIKLTQMLINTDNSPI